MRKSSYLLNYNWNCETITELFFFCHMWCTSSCSIYITRVCHQQNIYISSLYIICFLAFVSHNKVFALLLPFSVFLFQVHATEKEGFKSSKAYKQFSCYNILKNLDNVQKIENLRNVRDFFSFLNFKSM